MTDLDRTRPVRAYIHHLYADADDDTCRSRYLLLVIHPNVEQLRAAQAAYERQRDRKAGLKPAAQADDSEACGLWQPVTTQSRYDRRAKAWLDTTPPFLGVIRLAQGYLTPEIVAHECVHAALTMARRHDWAKPGNSGEANFGGSCDDSEEAFAYSLSRLIVAVESVVADACQRMGVSRG